MLVCGPLIGLGHPCNFENISLDEIGSLLNIFTLLPQYLSFDRGGMIHIPDMARYGKGYGMILIPGCLLPSPGIAPVDQ